MRKTASTLAHEILTKLAISREMVARAVRERAGNEWFNSMLEGRAMNESVLDNAPRALKLLEAPTRLHRGIEFGAKDWSGKIRKGLEGRGFLQKLKDLNADERLALGVGGGLGALGIGGAVAYHLWKKKKQQQEKAMAQPQPFDFSGLSNY